MAWVLVEHRLRGVPLGGIGNRSLSANTAWDTCCSAFVERGARWKSMTGRRADMTYMGGDEAGMGGVYIRPADPGRP